MPVRPFRILLVTFSDSGHLNPFIGVAQQLEQLGVEVVVYSMQSDVSERLRRAGVGASCFYSAAPGQERQTASPGAVPQTVLLTRRLLKPAFSRRWLSTVLLERLDKQVEDLNRIIEQTRPDIVALDSVAYAAAVSAEQSGRPWASIATSLIPLAPPNWRSAYTDLFDDLAEERDALLAKHGVSLRFVTSDVVSPWLNTVFAVEELVPREHTDNDYSFYVGPSVGLGPRGDEPEFGWERIRSDRSLVYVSFGSLVSPEPQVFTEIVSAFKDRGVQLVVAAKDLVNLPIFGEHEDVIAVKYAPQMKLLARASLAISHVGYNSLSECLSRSVPILGMPLVNDQHLNAEILVRSGAGAALDVSELSAESCWEAARGLLRVDSSCRAKARSIAASCRQRQGDFGVAELLHRLANERAPLRPR